MSPSTLNLSCACGRITGTLDISHSSLPLGFELCHCSNCRHVSGQLCISVLTAPRAPSDGASTLRMTKGEPIGYQSSEELIRHFCGHCGASIYLHIPETGDDEIATGVLDQAEGILQFKQHIFLASTKDGGLSSWLDGPAWTGWGEGSMEQSEEYSQPTPTSQTRSGKKDNESDERLKCHCHCRGVEFYITRPNEASSNNQPRDATWWLRANGSKYMAGICACNSCRLAAGYDTQAWAFIPKSNIRQVDGKEMEYSMGTLKRYVHSEGHYREFCSRCGATVFWHDEERPKVVDVSAGLLDAEEGARAEGWVEWRTERVGFEECAQNKSFVSKLSEGLRKWGEARSE
ncbi:MAG: hypothetical protein Q9186_002467 [Xanthomendoza sp. 1 TL-2023]